ncbi:MAG: hypothetical protein WD871_01745 [Xanthobacteraceae bacterium]
MPPPAPGKKSEREVATLVIHLVSRDEVLGQCGRRLICWVADLSAGSHVARDYCAVFRAEEQAAASKRK